MRKIRVLVTGGGSPGFHGTFKALVHNYDDREIDIIAADARCDVIGETLARAFYQIPRADERYYLEAMREIYNREDIDVVLPLNTAELELLAASDMNVSVSKNVAMVNDKYSLMGIAETLEIPFPETKIAFSSEMLRKAYQWFGGRMVVKPPVSNGSRGLRIIDSTKDYKQMYFHDKPGPYTTIGSLIEVLGDVFPPLLCQELVDGNEYTVDCFRGGGRWVAVPRLRAEITNGISSKTVTVDMPVVDECCRQISNYCGLEYAFGFQFKGGKLLECNPRVQGTMIASQFAGVNIIYSAVKLALGEEIPEFRSVLWHSKTIRYSVVKPI